MLTFDVAQYREAIQMVESHRCGLLDSLGKAVEGRFIAPRLAFNASFLPVAVARFPFILTRTSKLGGRGKVWVVVRWTEKKNEIARSGT